MSKKTPAETSYRLAFWRMGKPVSLIYDPGESRNAVIIDRNLEGKFFLKVMIAGIPSFIKLYFTNTNLSPSNNPRSLNFKWGITSNAINDSVINGEANADPASLAALSINEYCCAT